MGCFHFATLNHLHEWDRVHLWDFARTMLDCIRLSLHACSTRSVGADEGNIIQRLIGKFVLGLVSVLMFTNGGRKMTLTSPSLFFIGMSDCSTLTTRHCEPSWRRASGSSSSSAPSTVWTPSSVSGILYSYFVFLFLYVYHHTHSFKSQD